MTTNRQRANRPSRRRYAAIIRLLKQTIENEQVGLRTRLQAAERLDNLYARTELAELERERREEREKARLAKEQAPDDQPTTTGETVDQFLARIKAQKEQRTNDRNRQNDEG